MICENKNMEIVLETKGYELLHCFLCDLVFANNRNIKTESKEIYLNYYKKESAARFGFIIEGIIKFFRFIRALKVYILKPKGKKVLDIGSGRGWMLYYLKKYFNYEKAVGIQISENAFNFSKEKLNLEIHNKDFLEIPFDCKFDVVTILHVLEHVESVELYIQKMYELLNKDGILFVEVPNYNSWTRAVTRQYWLSLDLKHHITFFTPSSLVSLLKKYNFKIKKIRTFSWEYSAFTSTQSIINLITHSDSYFYEWLLDKKFNLKIILHIFLFSVIFLPCLIINLILFFSKRGEVLTIVAQKNEQ